MTRQRRYLIGGLAALAAVLLVVVGVAVADDDDDERDADGVWCYSPHLDELTPFEIASYPGDRMFAQTVETGDWTGTFTGTSTDYGVIVFDNERVNHALFAGTVIFDSVEVDGRTGGLEMDVHGGTWTGPNDWDGSWTIVDSSGELAGLEGSGTWWGPGFDPEQPDECGVIPYAVEELGDPDDD